MSGIAIAGTYMACLALSSTVSLNVLNPSIATAVVLEPIIFGTSLPLNTPAVNQLYNVNKTLSPFVGALIAAFIFFFQKKAMETHGVNYSKDFVRGSVRLNDSMV